VADLIKDVNRMENVVETNSQRLSELKKSIKDKLLEVDLNLDDSNEINNKGIWEFKYGVRRYKGNEPSIIYTEQRIEDLNKGFQKNIKNVSIICGKDCRSKEDIKAIFDNLDREYSKLTAELDIKYKEIPELINKEEDIKSYFSNLGEKNFEENLDEIIKLMDNENNIIAEELKKAALDIKEYETELKYQPENEEEMNKIDEELEDLALRKNYLEDTNISLKTALDVMTEASQEIQRDFVPALNNKMSDIIKRISGGRYSDLRADDKLNLKTISPETGEVVNTSLLSGGTIDQMYLALRVAMSEIFTNLKESLPLIMDEVFSQYDDDRTRETFKFLNNIVNDRQIIFFTCKGREVEIAKEIFGAEVNVIEI
jgi:DNA repair exonuclease SbcCD ATPase subunit